MTMESSSSLAEQCPAFDKGCPYTTNESKVESCPAFQKGCPFKGVASIDQMKEDLMKMPPSHTARGGVEHDQLVKTFAGIHKASSELKKTVGESCPIFSEECPFKGAVCSDGSLLVEEMEFLSFSLHHSESNIQVARKLKLGTRNAHRAAETVRFVKEFARGRVERQHYKHMIAQLYFVYQALEDGLEGNKKNPMVAPIFFPKELSRVQPIMHDLNFYWGPEWESMIKPFPITQLYVERLKYISKNCPSLLVAHAYTRYLGDLSGGQVLMKAAVRAMHLEDSQGTEFFLFDHIENHSEFKVQYRHRLDLLPVSEESADSLVAEANIAFVLNTHIFHQLDIIAGFADETAKPKLGSLPPPGEILVTQSLDDTSKASGCPFASLNSSSLPSHSGATQASQKTIGCPINGFNSLEVAAIFALAAVILWLIPQIE